MTGAANHLIVTPVVLPLLTGALLLLYDERRRVLKATVSVASTLALLVVAVVLLVAADGPEPAVYLLGNWPAPFGIVLVLDRLSAVMLLLTAVLAVASLTFSLTLWHRAGQHFHSLFQFLLMGTNGALLTGDLFNLFVFFEVMLAASYALALHGSGSARVRAGLHYIAVNLFASSLFLVGAAMLYGATGTLNMADMAGRIARLPGDDRLLVETGAAVLGVAFLAKAGMWPLSFWLPNTYSVVAAPIGAFFAILSKVGVYALLRLSLLLFGPQAGASAGFGGDLLLVGGMATVAFGMIGVLASQSLERLASYSVLVSSGTALAAVGFAEVGVTGGMLFYLVSSTLGLSAFFLLIEIIERGQNPAADMLAVTAEVFGDEEAVEREVGVPIPGAIAILGLAFLGCTMLLAGLPPLAGFIGKVSMLLALFQGDAQAGSGASWADWSFAALLVLSGLAALIAMTRTGIRVFWAPIEEATAQVSFVELMPVVLLVSLTFLMTIAAGPAMQYLAETAEWLHEPGRYVSGVLTALPHLPGGVEP